MSAASSPEAPLHSPQPQQTTPTIHEATLGGFGGGVQKGRQISQSDAEALRKSGRDIVVCGPVDQDNRLLARTIESNANGPVIYCAPHFSTGSNALPHYHPKSRKPRGHSFFETSTEKAI